jgi:branched-chain amino acid transport system ATP-binding protein
MSAALTIKNLTRRFGGLVAVDNVDLELASGKLNAIIGPNGAGKTTLFNLVTGLIAADRGEVHFQGADLIGLKPHQIVTRGVSRTLQIKSVFGGLTVADNLRAAVLSHRKIRNPIFAAASYSDVRREVERILVEVGIERLADTRASALSYGDVALLEIALALANRPKLLLLDEPICGMSPSETERTVSKIQALSKQIDIVIIEHDMEVVFAIADEITVMAQGRVLARGRPSEIANNPDVQTVYLGSPEDDA